MCKRISKDGNCFGCKGQGWHIYLYISGQDIYVDECTNRCSYNVDNTYIFYNKEYRQMDFLESLVYVDFSKIEQSEYREGV